jgi:hypothetical protein
MRALGPAGSLTAVNSMSPVVPNGCSRRRSAFLEYNFMGFSTQSAAFAGCGGTCVSAKGEIQDALVGVNYKF